MPKEVCPNFFIPTISPPLERRRNGRDSSIGEDGVTEAVA